MQAFVVHDNAETARALSTILTTVNPAFTPAVIEVVGIRREGRVEGYAELAGLLETVGAPSNVKPFGR